MGLTGTVKAFQYFFNQGLLNTYQKLINKLKSSQCNTDIQEHGQVTNGHDDNVRFGLPIDFVFDRTFREK